ncbi:MAG: hypothetical protein Q9227_005768 [Pyrenula ochraceoflavens]
MDDHESVSHRWDSECDFVCHRSDLVHSILQLVRTTRVVVIRATPQVGKTTLLRLLGRHILYEEKDLEPFFILWKRRDMRDHFPYQQYLEQEKSRWQEYNAEHRPHKPNATTIYLIDEAQDSYEDEQLWTQTLKNHNTGQQPMFVLVCLYGAVGLSHMREPNIESQALLMDRHQRVDLRPFLKDSDVLNPSALQLRNFQRIPEGTFQDEMYCCLNYELQSLPILSEYSHTKDGRIDFYVFDKKWGIEVLQSRRKADITAHIRRFQTGGKYQGWNILDNYIILNFCSKAALQEIEIKEASIQPRFLQIVIDPEECTAEVYTHGKQLQQMLDLGEGRQRYYAEDLDASEDSDPVQILQDQLMRVEREKKDMERRIAELERLAER